MPSLVDRPQDRRSWRGSLSSTPLCARDSKPRSPSQAFSTHFPCLFAFLWQCSFKLWAPTCQCGAPFLGLAPLAAALPVLAVGGMCNVLTSPPGTLPHRIHGFHSRCTAVSTRPTPLPPAMVAVPTIGFGNQGHARKMWLCSESTRHTVLPRPSRQCCGHIHPKWGSAASRGGQISFWRRRCCQWCARRNVALSLNGQHDGGCCCCAT